MNKFPLRALLAAGVVLAAITAALASPIGTDGTEKRFEVQGLRAGSLIGLTQVGTASGGAVTLNASGTRNPVMAGVITTETLTTAAGSTYTLTMTSNAIAATDVVLASIANGSNTGGAPHLLGVQEAAGSVVITVRNGQSALDTSLNGTLKIKFFIIKQRAAGTD